MPLAVKTPSGWNGTMLGKEKNEEEVEVSSPPMEMTRSGHLYCGCGTGKGGVIGN